MTFEEEQLEIKLDEAIDGKETSAEAEGLLKAGRAFVEAGEEKAAKAGLLNLLKKLPQANYSQKTTILTNLINSNYMTWKMSKIFALRSFGTVVAVLCLVIGVGLVGRKNLPENMRLQTASIQTTNLGASTGAAVGLGQSEGVYTRAKNAVIDAVAPSVEYAEPSIGILPPDMPYPQPPIYNNNDIRDTREYLKTSYYATLKSRHPNNLAERAQITIRGFGGRIDNANISEQNSYIGFALPKDKFEQFRNEIKTFVGAKFITENISSQNLLPQKQQIEASTEVSQASLEKQTTKKADLTSAHEAAVKSINAEAARLNKIIASLNAEAQTTTDTARLAAIANQKAVNYKALSANNIRLDEENKTFARQLASVNRQIEYINQQLGNLAKQDVGLEANVETVQGSLSFTKIGYWETLNIYLGGYLPALTWIAIGAVIFYLARRGKPQAEVQPVQ